MNYHDEIERLIELVRGLEDRVRALEAEVVPELESCIGFDTDESEAFDDDETEYVTKVDWVDGSFSIEEFVARDRNYFGD